MALRESPDPSADRSVFTSRKRRAAGNAGASGGGQGVGIDRLAVDVSCFDARVAIKTKEADLMLGREVATGEADADRPWSIVIDAEIL